MPGYGTSQASTKASQLRRLFFCLWLLLSPTAQATCPTDRIDQSATVSFIPDGDTVRLDNGEWVRFIGINTTEIGHGKRADEPVARAARQRLQALLAQQGMHVVLRFGSDRRDRHHRLLAHPFLPDGTNLTEQLLAEGLGFQVIIPPNNWGLECYRQAEQQARAAHRGGWAEAWRTPRDSRHLDGFTGGFMRVRGKVVRIGKSKKATWINLEGRVALKLANRDRAAFGDFNPDDLLGKTITVRGWFYPSKSKYDKLRTNLRHPSALELN